MNLLQSYELLHVKFPTRITDTNESLVDLISTTEEVQISKVDVTDIDGFSDNLATLCVFQTYLFIFLYLYLYLYSFYDVDDMLISMHQYLGLPIFMK